MLQASALTLCLGMLSSWLIHFGGQYSIWYVVHGARCSKFLILNYIFEAFRITLFFNVATMFQDS
jgi:hypothetical protein